MNLKNYTSEVPAVITIGRIEQLLAEAGASHIAKEYDGRGKISSLAFRFILPANGCPITIRLPANPDAVYEQLMKKISKPLSTTPARVRAQAERCAWKLMQDWVEVQLSLIAMEQAEFLQVFLPYVHDGRQSFYEQIKGRGFKALAAPKE